MDTATLDRELGEYFYPGWHPPPPPDGEFAPAADAHAATVLGLIGAEADVTRFPRTTERVAALVDEALMGMGGAAHVDAEDDVSSDEDQGGQVVPLPVPRPSPPPEEMDQRALNAYRWGSGAPSGSDPWD